MGTRRAMVILENVSGKPEDRFVNTFHFSPDSTGGEIVNALRNFYNGGANGGLAAQLSTNITRASGLCRIKVYDLSDGTPRQPINDEGLDLNAAASTAGNLPNELAACLSVYGTRNLPRQRGRVFLGPFTLTALEQASGTNADELVSGTLISYILAAANTLRTDAEVDWCVYSPVSGLVWPITNGWVDKAWDIQRRRGVKSAQRFAMV